MGRGVLNGISFQSELRLKSNRICDIASIYNLLQIKNPGTWNAPGFESYNVFRITIVR